MAEVIRACKENDISFFADFELDENEENGALYCTSGALLSTKHEMIALLARCTESGGVNIDKFCLALIKKYGPGNSIFLHRHD